MTTHNRSLDLYARLANQAKSLGIAVPAAHNQLFCVNKDTEQYYSQLYTDQHKSKSAVQKRPGTEICKYCEQFHLSNLKTIDKRSDIKLGNALENVFQVFLANELQQRGVKCVCRRADTEDFHMPDFQVSPDDATPGFAYFEFKVIFRPFLKIASKVNSEFECYSHSLTLDLKNGTKLLDQRRLVETALGNERVFYVYWYDLPCLKGVFWMPSKRVYEIMDTQAPYARREVAGDFNSWGTKNSATHKLYLPLVEMGDFESLLSQLASSAPKAH